MPRGRPKKVRPAGLPTTEKPCKQKALVQKNRTAGLKFEDRVCAFFNKYFQDRNITAVVHKLPTAKFYDQPIDVLIDSKDWGYCGIECKVIDDIVMTNEKINLKKLSRKNAAFGHQFRKEHIFLKNGGRYGLIAFWFKGLQEIIFMPHQYVYDLIEDGVINITISDIIKKGYHAGDEASLKLYIRKNCKTV